MTIIIICDKRTGLFCYQIPSQFSGKDFTDWRNNHETLVEAIKKTLTPGARVKLTWTHSGKLSEISPNYEHLLEFLN